MDERRVQVVAQPIEDDGPRPGFDPRELARAMRGRMGAVRACYERALRVEPTLAGRVDVDVQVERVGTLSDVHVREGSIGDDAFHGCVERAVRAVRLPSGPEDGPASVSFPFVFAPQS
jgi:TonB family protein